MKAFLLLLALIAAGVWFAAPSIRPPKLLTDANRELLLSRMEDVLYWVAETFPNSFVERRIEDVLGLCRVLTAPAPESANPIADMKPAPDKHFPFARPATLSKLALLCGFPDHGKSILVIPANDQTTFMIQRSPGKSALLSLQSGELTLVSDQLDLDSAAGAMHLKFRSAAPVLLTFKKGESQLSLLIRRGQLDLTFERTKDLEKAVIPLLVQIMPGTALLSDGKIISNKKSMKVLPTGFQEDVSPPFGAPLARLPEPSARPAVVPQAPEPAPPGAAAPAPVPAVPTRKR